MKDNKVHILKLSTGEDICGVIINENDKHITLSDPATFYNVILNSGSTAQTLQPYSKFSDNKIAEINKNNIVSVHVALDAVASYYRTYIDYLFISNYIFDSVNEESNKATELYHDLIKEHQMKKFDEKVLLNMYNLSTEDNSMCNDDVILYNMEVPSKSIN